MKDLIKNTGRFVRRKNGLPIWGMVKREDQDILGNPIFIVAQYGYNANEEIGWAKIDCEELTPPAYIDIEGWLALSNKNNK